MKALITGANGQVGSALQEAAPPGCEVALLTRADMELSDAAAIRRVVEEHQPDVLFNCAAYTAVDKAESEPELAQAINGDAVRAMASAMRNSGGGLVQVSTDFVFDGKQSSPYKPGDRRNPLGIYGATKAAGEDAAGAEAIIVRTSWVYAAGGANFVRTMLRLMSERDELSVVADQIGAPTWATGLATTLWALAAKDRPGIYHHSDAGAASWYDFAIAIQEEALELGMLGRSIPIHPIPGSLYPTPAKRPAFSLLDDSATRALLGDASTGGHSHWRVNLRTMLKEELALG